MGTRLREQCGSSYMGFWRMAMNGGNSVRDDDAEGDTDAARG